MEPEILLSIVHDQQRTILNLRQKINELQQEQESKKEPKD